MYQWSAKTNQRLCIPCLIFSSRRCGFSKNNSKVGLSPLTPSCVKKRLTKELLLPGVFPIAKPQLANWQKDHAAAFKFTAVYRAQTRGLIITAMPFYDGLRPAGMQEKPFTVSYLAFSCAGSFFIGIAMVSVAVIQKEKEDGSIWLLFEVFGCCPYGGQPPSSAHVSLSFHRSPRRW